MPENNTEGYNGGVKSGTCNMLLHQHETKPLQIHIQKFKCLSAMNISWNHDNQLRMALVIQISLLFHYSILYYFHGWISAHERRNKH